MACLPQPARPSPWQHVAAQEQDPTRGKQHARHAGPAPTASAMNSKQPRAVLKALPGANALRVVRAGPCTAPTCFPNGIPTSEPARASAANARSSSWRPAQFCLAAGRMGRLVLRQIQLLTILPRIVFMSAGVNARIVCDENASGASERSRRQDQHDHGSLSVCDM